MESDLSVDSAISVYETSFRKIGFILEHINGNWLSIQKSEKKNKIATSYRNVLIALSTLIIVAVAIWLQQVVTLANSCDMNAKFVTCNSNVCPFDCVCNIGWIGNGTDCEDICTRRNVCVDNNALCNQDIDSDLGYRCYCNPGWSGDGFSCVPKHPEVMYKWYLVNDVFKNLSDHSMIGVCDESFDPDTIVLLGGNNYHSNVYHFDILSNTITKMESIANLNVAFEGQNYVTMNGLVYYWNGVIDEHLYTFNLQTSEILPMQENVFSDESSGRVCITSDNENIMYVISVDYLRMYNIQTNEWSSGSQSNSDRSRASCIYWNTQDKLYVFGGYLSERVQRTSSISSLSPAMNNGSEWVLISSELTDKVKSTTAYIIVRGETAIILGNSYPSLYSHGMFCNLFQLPTETITKCKSLMNIKRSYFTPVYSEYHGIIYGFAGLRTDKLIDWLKFDEYTRKYSTCNSLEFMSVKEYNFQYIEKIQNTKSSIDGWETLVNATLNEPGVSLILGHNVKFDKDQIIVLFHMKTYTYKYILDIPSKTLIKDPYKIDNLMIGIAQSYTTLQSNIYWTYKGRLFIYNMFTSKFVIKTGWYKFDWLEQKRWWSRLCITSNGANQIYIIGATYLQMYNIYTHEWKDGPLMKDDLILGSCVYSKEYDTLYYFGGSDTFKWDKHAKDQWVTTIQMLRDMSNPNAWQISATRLTAKIQFSHAFIDDIHRTVFIIGGSDGDSFISRLLCNEFMLLEEQIKECLHDSTVPRYYSGGIFSPYHEKIIMFRNRRRNTTEIEYVTVRSVSSSETFDYMLPIIDGK
eukprot:318048_1